MNAAEDRGETSGKVILDFINRENKGREDKDQWKLTLTDGDIGKFSITPPKSAKPGDFIAVPVEYTYTNGSKDVHWFHFVVEESDNYRPEYHAKSGYKGDSLTTKPEPLPSKNETKKNLPTSYELVPGTYKDSAGNVWENISVNKETGEVTAIVPEAADIKGGETLFVDVKVNYIDEDGTKSEETIKAQFIARPKYKEEVTKEFTSEIPFETKVVYDENLEAGKIEKTEGIIGEMKTSFKQVVINGEKGIINDAGEFVKNQEIVEVKTTKEKQDAIIRIGTKPAETKVEIPFDTEYELDYTRKDGDPVEITPGQKGEITVKTSRDPETGEIKVTQEETKAPKKRKLSIPAGTEGVHKHEEKIPFKYDITYDKNLKAGEYVIDVEGKEGTKTTKWNIKNSKIDGEPIVDIENPVDAKIRVGQKDFTGTVKNTVTKEVPYTVKVVENPNLDAGKTNVKQEGKAGSRTYEYSGEIVNGQLKDGTNFTEKEITDKYVEAIEHIIEIGTKPVENSKDVESEVGVDVEWVFDPNKDIGVIEVGDLIPGKVTTKTVNKYNPKTGKIETTQETIVEKGKRKVIAGTKAYDGEFDQVNKNIIPYETEIVFDNTLKAGEKEITQAGEDGLKTTTTKHKIVNGEVVSSGDPVTEVNKEAVKQIIKVGTMTDGKHSHTEKLPFETKVEVNPELKKGEWRYKTVDGVEQKGKIGSRKTEWTIKNSEVQAEPKVTEDRPIDAIIEVGSADFEGEVKHTEHFEIPFEVEVRYNKDLPDGKTKEIQKGVKGSYDVEYKQNIKNGQADGEMTRTESNRVEAKKHIIEIGSKVETPEKTYSKDVEVEIEYVYDDTKDKGFVETGELTPGKVETKIVDKYNTETGKVEQTSEEVVTKAKQKVIVGTKDFTGKYEYKKTCPLPFEVEIIEDDTLAKGKKVVDQVGKPGSKTTSYEQDIKNGNLNGEAKQTDEKITEEPTKHIVRVGTKPLERTRENVVDKAISYETKVIYDEDLEAGTRLVDNEGKDGKERVTTTITSKDGDIEYNSEGKILTPKEDRVVRVGVKPVEKETELPFGTEYVYDDNLDAGKIETTQEGKNGTAKIITSFDKETGKLETKVERTEPTKRIIKIGRKPNDNMCPAPEIPEIPDQEKPNKSVNPGKTPEKPENPTNPGEPGQENPGKPGQENPGKPGQEDPSKPGRENPGKTDSKSEVDSKIVEAEKEKDIKTKEEISREEKTSKKVEKDLSKKSYNDDSRAPQTFDPGVASYLGLGGITSTMLAYLEYRKRKNK